MSPSDTRYNTRLLRRIAAHGRSQRNKVNPLLRSVQTGRVTSKYDDYWMARLPETEPNSG
jgi:hypothetical protein